jgi:hypothetical protein
MMNKTPVAGTFQLDGMLQGNLPADDHIADDIQNWIDAARKQGLLFHLQVEGRSFTIVSDPSTCKSSALGNKKPAALIEAALNSLLERFPKPFRSSIFSTIRSEEFRPGLVIQTLYSVSAEGTITSEQRSLDIETELPLPEMTAASIRRFAVVSLLAILLGFFISSFFIDYRKLFSQARDQVVPLKLEEVSVEQATLNDIIRFKLIDIDVHRDALLFEITRGPNWDRAMNSSPSEASVDWSEFLMRQAIHQGRLRAELYDKNGKPLSKGEITISGLLLVEKTQVVVVAELRDRLSTVVITH